jgi:hypothetical protein
LKAEREATNAEIIIRLRKLGVVHYATIYENDPQDAIV